MIGKVSISPVHHLNSFDFFKDPEMVKDVATQSAEHRHLSSEGGSDADDDRLSDSQNSRSSEEAEFGEFPITQVHWSSYFSFESRSFARNYI